MNSSVIFALLVVLTIQTIITNAFQFQSVRMGSTNNVRGRVSMEYIPDGLTPAQWAAIKKKEAEAKKAAGNLGAMGTTKFKSRSFEAWQKAGGKHLFPVDPTTTSYEERPYMQRKDGDWEGSDLKKRGLATNKGQGAASSRLALDDLYEEADKKGLLNSASFLGGIALPWTGAQAKSTKGGFDPKNAGNFQRGTAGKKLSPEEVERLKKSLAKPVISKKGPVVEDAAPKKRFGFF